MAQLNNTPETELPSLAERHKSILDILQLQGSVSVSDLAERLEVSEVTIRKDLSALEKQNKLYRTHGRAIPISPYIGDRHINEKEKQFVLEKRAIGKVAASMVNEHDSILMASGTSILYAAKELVEKKNITVISASVSASSLLSQNKDIDVVQLGGIVRESSVSVVGSFAEAMLKYFNCNLLFMGADGVDLEFGVTTTNMMEANLNRMMMNTSQQTVLLVDSSKFGKKGFIKICDVGEIDRIITDDKIPQIYLESLQEQGIEVTSLPGAAACVTALTMSGQPTRRFAFEAFLPKDKKEHQAVLAELAEETRTIILYEAPHHLVKTLQELSKVLGADRRLTICRELTKRHEEKMQTTLGDSLHYYEAKEPRGEYVLVIEGKSRAQIEREQQAEWETMSIEEHMAHYESQGIDRKEAMKLVAKDRGVSKRDIYQSLLS